MHRSLKRIALPSVTLLLFCLLALPAVAQDVSTCIDKLNDDTLVKDVIKCIKESKLALNGNQGGAVGNDLNVIPVGTIVAYYGPSAPVGWLICNGDPIPPEHTALIYLIGQQTPNLRGYFLRGLDPTGKIDPDGAKRQIGSSQSDLVGPHNHRYATTLIGSAGKSGAGRPDVAADQSTRITEVGDGMGLETRPKNIAVNYLIKY